jgi:hypothetical protein
LASELALAFTGVQPIRGLGLKPLACLCVIETQTSFEDVQPMVSCSVAFDHAER